MPDTVWQIELVALLRASWYSDVDKRRFYENEDVNSGWSVRELTRHIESSLFERLLLSKGDLNNETVLALAENGIDISEPSDIIRKPYVFEFLRLPETSR